MFDDVGVIPEVGMGVLIGMCEVIGIILEVGMAFWLQMCDVVGIIDLIPVVVFAATSAGIRLSRKVFASDMSLTNMRLHPRDRTSGAMWEARGADNLGRQLEP